MARAVSNPLALAVLASLWERPMYPYEITTSLRSRGKESSIRLNFGSLYSVIKSLEKHALIRPARTEREGNRPERIVYEITDEGRAEAESWLRELLEVPAKEYPAIETGLSLVGILPPDEVVMLLRSRISRLDAQIDHDEAEFELPETKRIPEIFLIEGQFNLAMLKAERTVLEGFAERIAAGTYGGQAMWAGLHSLLAAGKSMEEIRADQSPLGEEYRSLNNE